MAIGNPTPTVAPAGTTTISVPITANYTDTQLQRVINCVSQELSTVRATHTITQQGAVLTVTPSSYSISYSGGNSGQFTVNSTFSYTASSNQTWATIVYSGSGFYLRVSENGGTANRTATITVSNGVISRTVTLTQEGMPIYFRFNPSSGTGDYTAQPISNPRVASLETNLTTTWNISSNASWLQVALNSESGTGSAGILFYYPVNTGTSARSAVITAVSGTYRATYTFTQAANAETLSISPTSASGAAAGGTGSFNVTSNSEWRATGSTNIAVTAGGTGSGNGSVSYSYAANTTGAVRNLPITVALNSGARSAIFNLNQVATDPELRLVPNSYVFSGAASQTNVNLYSSSAWTASSNATWLTTSPSGVGNAALIIRAAANPNNNTRSGTITFTNTEGITATFIASQQAGGTLAISPTEIMVNGAESFVIYISGTPGVAWSARSNNPVLSVPTTSGTTDSSGGSTCPVYIGSATSEYQYGIITISWNGGSASCNVTVRDMNA